MLDSSLSARTRVFVKTRKSKISTTGGTKNYSRYINAAKLEV